MLPLKIRVMTEKTTLENKKILMNKLFFTVVFITLSFLTFPVYPEGTGGSFQSRALIEENYRTKISRLIEGIYGEERRVSVEVIVFPLDDRFDMENRDSYKLSTAVFIDGDWHFVFDEKKRFIIEDGGIRKRTCTLLNEEKKVHIGEAIKVLTGYDQTRGDIISVSSLAFDRNEQFRAEDAKWKKSTKRGTSIMSFLLFAFFIVVGITVYRVIVRDMEYRRKLREDEMEREFILRAGEKHTYR